MKLYDKTMKKGKQTISVKAIRSLDLWKDAHQSEMNIKAIRDNDNCV